jgi:hypothetical protein
VGLVTGLDVTGYRGWGPNEYLKNAQRKLAKLAQRAQVEHLSYSDLKSDLNLVWTRDPHRPFSLYNPGLLLCFVIASSLHLLFDRLFSPSFASVIVLGSPDIRP